MTTDPISPELDSQLPRFDTRMSDAEGLMWRLEKDPYLTSTFGNVTVLDRPLNFEAFTKQCKVDWTIKDRDIAEGGRKIRILLQAPHETFGVGHARVETRQ